MQRIVYPQEFPMQLSKSCLWEVSKDMEETLLEVKKESKYQVLCTVFLNYVKQYREKERNFISNSENISDFYLLSSLLYFPSFPRDYFLT